MHKTWQKIITSWIFICLVGSTYNIAPTQAAEIDISSALSQVGTETTVGEKTLYDVIQENDNNNVSPGFKSWAQNLQQMHETMKNRANEEIKKADSLEETTEIAEMNNEILEMINSRIDSATNTNELTYLDALQKHYNRLKSDLKQLGVFNEAYEFLVIMSGGDLDIAGTTKDNKTLRQEYESKTQEAQSATSLEPTQTSDTYTGEEPPGGYSAFNQLPMYNAVNTTANYICQLYPETSKAYAQDNAPGTDYSPENDTPSRQQRPAADANPDREEDLPFELAFSDPAEESIFLPQTFDEAVDHINKGEAVDPRVYFFVYHILQQMRAGQNEDGTAGEDFIQEASTPNAVQTICKGDYDADPQKCDGPQLTCGLSQTAYALQWLLGDIDNIGSIFGERTHMEIWIGLNSPTISDEYNKEEGEGTARSAHKDFKAVDVSAVGLYNERLDCAACKGLEPCTPDCLLLATPTPQCCPILPLPLDNAVDALTPVEVKWSHEDITDDILNSAANDLMGNIIDPDIINNGTHIKSILGLLGKDAINQFIGGEFGDFDFFQLLNGSFEDFMLQAGNNFLFDEIYGPLGFPEEFAYNFNWNNPESFFTNLASGYLGEAFGLPNGMMTPLLSAAMSGNFKESALSALNMTSNLDIPANIRNYMDIAIQNADNPKAIGLAFANIGTGQINNIMGWPAGTLDINNLSGQGFEAIANRLTGYGLSKVSGLPSDFIIDIKNPQNTLSSLSGSLISKSIGNYEISNFITQSITSGETPSLNSVLKQFAPEDISSLLNLDTDQSDIAIQIYEHIQNPTDHSTFINSLSEQIDIAELGSQNPYINESALKTILHEGTSPSLGDSGALTKLATNILFDKAGVNLSDTDIEKIEYLVRKNQIDSSSSSNTTPTNTFPGFSGLPNFNNTNLANPNISNLNNEFIQEFGGTENLISFEQRIFETINNSEDAQDMIRDIENYTAPIAVTFANTSDLNDFLRDINNPNSTNTYDYTDTIQMPTRDSNNSTTYIPTNNILKDIGIDINQVNLFTAESAASNTNNSSLANPLGNYISGLNTSFGNNQTYYIYPKVNLAQMLIPGYQNSSNDQIGKFRLLETLTDVIQYSYDRPIQISIYKEGETPSTNTGFDFSNFSNLGNNNLPNNLTGNPALTDTNNSLKIAIENKFTLPYVNPTGEYGGQPIDLLTNFGTTPAIYDAISQIGVDNDQAESLFTSIGQLQTASNMTGVNAISSVVNSFTDTDASSTLNDLGNTMGLLEGMRSGDPAQGINTAVNFMEQYDVLEKIAPTSWDVDGEGNLISNVTDVTSIYSSLKSGNYASTLQNIPGISDELSKFTDYAGFDANQIFNTLNNPSPENISQFALDIAANRISSQSGIEKLAAFEELTTIFGGMPPDVSQIPSKIPQLIQSDLFKDSIFANTDPQLLGDVSDVFGLIQSGGNPKDIIQTFSTTQIFKNMVGSEKYSEFLGENGDLINAITNGDPKSIAQSFMNKYSTDIDSWLSDNGMSEYMNIASIQGLINGDIKSFVKDTTIKYTSELFSGDSAIASEYSGLVNSVFQGDVPYEQIGNFIMNNFFTSDASNLCITYHKTNERYEAIKKAQPEVKKINQDIHTKKPKTVTFLEKFINLATGTVYASIRNSGGGPCPKDLALSDDMLKTQLTGMLKDMLIDKLTSLFSEAIFKECRREIAEDNIIHFMDIALNYYQNPLTRNYFLVNEQEKEDGERVAVEELDGLRRFHPFQIFSDFTDDIFEKIEEKSQQVFEDVWYTTRIGRINVFQQTCHERENEYLKDCEEFIHFGW